MAESATQEASRTGQTDLDRFTESSLRSHAVVLSALHHVQLEAAQALSWSGTFLCFAQQRQTQITIIISFSQAQADLPDLVNSIHGVGRSCECSDPTRQRPNGAA